MGRNLNADIPPPGDLPPPFFAQFMHGARGLEQPCEFCAVSKRRGSNPRRGTSFRRGWANGAAALIRKIRICAPRRKSAGGGQLFQSTKIRPKKMGAPAFVPPPAGNPPGDLPPPPGVTHPPKWPPQILHSFCSVRANFAKFLMRAETISLSHSPIPFWI